MLSYITCVELFIFIVTKFSDIDLTDIHIARLTFGNFQIFLPAAGDMNDACVEILYYSVYLDLHCVITYQNIVSTVTIFCQYYILIIYFFCFDINLFFMVLHLFEIAARSQQLTGLYSLDQ